MGPSFVFTVLCSYVAQSCSSHADVSSCPAGALVGSMTNQISAIRLTRQGQPASTSDFFPSLSSPSPTQESLLEETPPPPG